MADQAELAEEIRQLKEERNAVILAHNYQLPEIQDIADFLGDSLGLSQQAAATEAHNVQTAVLAGMADAQVGTITGGTFDSSTDLDISGLLQYHRRHGKIGTVTGICPSSRYGELMIDKDQVLAFDEKQKKQNNFVNGGYFVFNRKFLRYLEDGDDCILEGEPLEKLASDGELKVFHHKGFWQCMDTHRDRTYLNEIWGKERPLWKVW